MFQENVGVYFVDFGEHCFGDKGNFLGIFNSEFFAFEGFDDDRLMVVTQTKEVSKYRRGDSFKKGGQEYTIKGIQPDGALTNLICF